MKLAKVWPRQPFVGLGLATILGILVAEAWPFPVAGIAIALSLAATALFRGRSLLTYCFVAASFFYLHSSRQTISPGLRLAQELGPEPVAIAVCGIVISEPKVSARGMATFHLRLKWTERDGQRHSSGATILARWRGDVRYGDELQLFGVAEPVEGPRNPGEFDMRRYLARRDIRHTLVVRYPENGRVLARDRGSAIMRAAQSSRNWMQAALARGLEDSPDLSGLISAMVLGVREETPDEIEEQFQQTGTLHLFAVSGLNVAIIAQLLWILASAVRIPRRWAIALIIPALFFYASVTGLNTSSVRAALMAAVLLGGFFVDRKVLAANSVAAAGVLILCFDTNQFFSIGFQLSFAVVIAIILSAEGIFQLLVRWCRPDPFLPNSLLSPMQRLGQGTWRMIARGLSVSLAAWIGSLPLILPYFYLVTPVSLLANLVVVPLAFFVLAVGLLSLLVMPIAPALAIVLNNANWSLAAAILASVELFTRAPAGHFYVELPHRRTRARVEITALDFGAGAALHLRTRRRDWLFDCGSESRFRRIGRSYLRSRGVNRLQGLILTHGDSAHLGAAPMVLRAFKPREIVDTAVPDRSSAHRRLSAYLQEHSIPRQLCAAPEELQLSREVRARILFPPAEYKASNADDQALVTQLVVSDRWRVLLMSDSGEETEQLLVASGENLQSEMLIKGQHHSGVSGSAQFIERVQPQLIVASSADFPENERINAEWAADLAARGIKLFRQDQTGAVTLRFFRDRWEAVPYLPAETFRSTSR
ncbi:MAG: ComEC/Rec2 family competence protein [Chthoniobacterales bacterium]